MQQCPRFRPGDARFGVNPHTLHRRQIDHDAALADAFAGNVVTATPHRRQQLIVPGQVDRVGHVRRALALHDQRRPFVDHAVPDLAGRVIAFAAGQQQPAAQAGREFLDNRFLDDFRLAAAGDGVDVPGDLRRASTAGCEQLPDGHGRGNRGGQRRLDKCSSSHSLWLLIFSI